MTTTVAADIARQVRLALVTGELDRDRTYAEPELLTLARASRPVLREALRVLESERLVTVRRGPRGGARFNYPDVVHVARYAALLLYHSGTTLGDIEQARGLFEAEIVRDIGIRRADVRQAESVLVGEAAHLDQPNQLPRLAANWHAALLGCARNSAQDAVLEIVDLSTTPLAEVAWSRTAGADDSHRNLQRSHIVHAQVLQRLQQGDADGAADLWLRHTRAGKRLFSAVACRERLDLLDLIDGVTPDTEPARPPKGADIVASALRRRIVTGELRQGDRVPTENTLAGEWDLAAPSVREAVRILATEGLVMPVRGSHLGPVVRPPDAGIAARRMAFVLAAANASLDDLRQAVAVLARSAATLIAEDPGPQRLSALSSLTGEGATECSIVDALLEGTGNSTLRVLGTLLTTISRDATQVVAQSGAGRHRPAPSPRELIELLAAGDAGDARKWILELLPLDPETSLPLTRPDVLDMLI